MLILSRAAKDLNGIFNNFQEDTSALVLQVFVSRKYSKMLSISEKAEVISITTWLTQFFFVRQEVRK